MPETVSSEWLNACSGCEISILNIGDALLDLIPSKLSLVHIPALVDSKYFGPLGDGSHLTLPEATVGFLSGAVRNQEHKEVAEEMRKKVKGDKAKDHPKRFTGIEVEYVVKGKNISEEAVKRAVELSMEKYCSVKATLEGSAKISFRCRIVEE